MTQFLASIEKHPELSTYKISTRAESIVIEGVSSENELVPLVTADNVLTGILNFKSENMIKNNCPSLKSRDNL